MLVFLAAVSSGRKHKSVLAPCEIEGTYMKELDVGMGKAFPILVACTRSLMFNLANSLSFSGTGSRVAQSPD